MASRTGRRTVGAFDIRVIIAALFCIYGVVLTIVGAMTSGADIARSANVNINLLSGIGMVVVAALFAVWARLRPIVMPAESADERSREH
jgi:quinol-cytochrome oxidoreductase complex cytochrome b subunit